MITSDSLVLWLVKPSDKSSHSCGGAKEWSVTVAQSKARRSLGHYRGICLWSRVYWRSNSGPKPTIEEKCLDSENASIDHGIRWSIITKSFLGRVTGNDRIAPPKCLDNGFWAIIGGPIYLASGRKHPTFEAGTSVWEFTNGLWKWLWPAICRNFAEVGPKRSKSTEVWTKNEQSDKDGALDVVSNRPILRVTLGRKFIKTKECSYIL